MEMRSLFYKDIGIRPLYQHALYRHSFYNEPVGGNLPQKAVHKRCDPVPYYHFYCVHPPKVSCFCTSNAIMTLDFLAHASLKGAHGPIIVWALYRFLFFVHRRTLECVLVRVSFYDFMH